MSGNRQLRVCGASGGFGGVAGRTTDRLVVVEVGEKGARSGSVGRGIAISWCKRLRLFGWGCSRGVW